MSQSLLTLPLFVTHLVFALINNIKNMIVLFTLSYFLFAFINFFNIRFVVFKICLHNACDMRFCNALLDKR